MASTITRPLAIQEMGWFREGGSVIVRFPNTEGCNENINKLLWFQSTFQSVIRASFAQVSIRSYAAAEVKTVQIETSPKRTCCAVPVDLSFVSVLQRLPLHTRQQPSCPLPNLFSIIWQILQESLHTHETPWRISIAFQSYHLLTLRDISQTDKKKKRQNKMKWKHSNWSISPFSV